MYCMFVVNRPIHTIQCYTKQKETGSQLQCSHINFLTMIQQKRSVPLKILLWKSPGTNETEKKHGQKMSDWCSTLYLKAVPLLYFVGQHLCSVPGSLVQFSLFCFLYIILQNTLLHAWPLVFTRVEISSGDCVLFSSASGHFRTTLVRLSLYYIIDI